MTEAPIRRVIVAIDTGGGELRVLRYAVSIAKDLGAQIEGLFIEDVDLLAWAAQPFARRFGAGAVGKPLSPGDIEAEWRGVARALRRALEVEAQSARIEARFAVVRTRPRDVVRALEADVTVVAWGGRPPAQDDLGPVRALYDGSEASERALAAALRVATGPLEVFVDAGAEARAEVQAEDLAARLPRGSIVRILAEPQGLLHAARERPGGALFVPIGHALVAELGRGERLACTVAIVK